MKIVKWLSVTSFVQSPTLSGGFKNENSEIQTLL